MQQTERIIVIGGGPVGLVTALQLTKAGIPVVILEASPLPHAEPRASTFHPPTLDLLDTVGLGSRLVALGRAAPTWQYCMFETGERAVFDLGILKEETNHPYRLQCEQLNLVIEATKMLEDIQPGALLLNARATAVAQDERGVTVTANIAGEQKQLRGSWLIGADGAGSIVRKHLNLAFEGETYPMASVAIGTPFPFHDYLNGLCGVNYFWADGWSFSMFRTQKIWRIGSPPPEELDDKAAVKDELVQERLGRIVPEGRPFETVTARVYRVHRRLVECFRVGRMLLAGDAAHLNSPSGGFGMNSGVHDAFNLADKLTQVWHGENESLLDLYSRQRHFAASADIQTASDVNHKRHRLKDKGKRLAALKEMQAIAENPKRLYPFLRASSLIDSLERANAVK